METHEKFFHYASIFLLFVVNAAGIVLTLLNVFQCRPVSAALEFNPPASVKCVNLISLYLCSAPINVLTDAAIVLLPLPILTNMRMEMRQKAVLVATFLTGIFITVVDIIRIAYLQDALSEAAVIGRVSWIVPFGDIAWNASLSFMWSLVEMHVGIVCACVLVLKPLARRVFPTHTFDTPEMPSGQFDVQTTTDVYHHDYVDGVHQIHPEPVSLSPKSKAVPIPPVLQIPGDSPVLPSHVSPPTGSPGPAFFAQADSQSPGLTCLSSGLSVRSSKMEAPSSSEKPAKPPLKLNKAGEGQFKAKEIDLENMDIMDFLAVDQSDPNAVILPWDPDNCDIPDLPGLSTLDQVAVDHLLPPPAAAPKSQKCTVPVRCAPTVMPGQAPPAAFSDFIAFDSHKYNKSMLDLSAREAWRSVLLVSTLFAVWGLAYGFLGSLTSQIQRILEFTDRENLAQHNAYWIGYTVGPILGFFVLSRFGFKATFLVGLGIFSCGAMSFWPASTLASFSGLFVSQFFSSFGLSCLEIAANPYIALAGPQHLNEARLNFAQGFQATAAALSPVLLRRVILHSVTTRARLVDTQWAYLAIALFVIILGVVFFYISIPEATDEDFDRVSTARLNAVGLDQRSTIGGASAGGVLAGVGVVTMLAYLGGQETLYYFWNPIAQEIKPGASGDAVWSYQEAALSLHAVGRFSASGIAYLGVPGRYLLTVCVMGGLVTTVLAAHLPNQDGGSAPLAFLILSHLFQAPIFPTLFAIVIRNQGAQTKLVSMGLTIATGAGGVLLSITFALRKHESTRHSINTVIGFYTVAMVLPILLNASSVMRRWIDPMTTKRNHSNTGSDSSGLSANSIRHRVSSYFGKFSIEHREHAVEMQPRHSPDPLHSP
ncbi:hypothetical protein QFC19_001295 [Naganishia cerealis]|uniref:Uncharacterized protein n=1 Tax=Naganishia cerealis TaxID=610337 RepID=A0ACC2WI71_9TREE|nr:hypothetical protein QFC19_001295 [Naganishia cerealis]